MQFQSLALARMGEEEEDYLADYLYPLVPGPAEVACRGETEAWAGEGRGGGRECGPYWDRLDCVLISSYCHMSLSLLRVHRCLV